MNQKFDRRVSPVACEVRERDGKRYFAGRAWGYNEWSELLENSFRERLVPGCFDECLRGAPDIIASYDHNSSCLLGRVASGTLKLDLREDGGYVEVEAGNTTAARDLSDMIGRKDVRGMSFIFNVRGDRWYNEEGVVRRDVLRADIYEVSFVVFPAYPATECAMRSLDAWRASTLHGMRLRLSGK